LFWDETSCELVGRTRCFGAAYCSKSALVMYTLCTCETVVYIYRSSSLPREPQISNRICVMALEVCCMEVRSLGLHDSSCVNIHFPPVLCAALLLYSLLNLIKDRLCGLVVSVADYKHKGPGFDSRALLRIFLKELGLERGPLSLVIG
jgi:hypothetical protein